MLSNLCHPLVLAFLSISSVFCKSCQFIAKLTSDNIWGLSYSIGKDICDLRNIIYNYEI